MRPNELFRAAVAEERVFQSWLACQEGLKRALAPLSAEQLALRPLPGRRTIGEIAEHIIFGRALHLHGVLGDAASELTPFLRWNEAASASRSAEEIVHGLEVTWQVIANYVMRGAPTDEVSTGNETLTMQVVWGLLDHDLPHAGQLSLLLRSAGLPGVEI